MIVGYARTSTADQVAGLEDQVRELKAAGATKIFAEQVSSVDVPNRRQLQAALDYLRDDDVLVVTKPDRLARSVVDLLGLADQVAGKGASLRVLSMSLDTSSATGRLILTTLGGVAEFERALMLERQRAGIAKAKAEGKYRGRVPTARRKAMEILQLKAAGVGAAEIARRLGLGRSSVYRVLEETRSS